MTCPAGGYPTARHNKVRDVIGGIIKEVAADVETEPTLSPYEGESLHGRTANRAGEARLDIRALGFWTRQQDAYFDVRVTHPKASLLSCQELRRQLEQNEQEKKRRYGQRVTEIERGSFTPLVFATNGMCARESFFEGPGVTSGRKEHWPSLFRGSQPSSVKIVIVFASVVHHMPSWLPCFLYPHILVRGRMRPAPGLGLMD